MVQKNNGKTKKKQHARLPAQVPASSVSKSPGGNYRQERKDAVSGQKRRETSSRQTAWARQMHEKEKGGGQHGLRQRAGAKRQWCLGSEEFIVPSEGLGGQHLADFAVPPYAVSWGFRA